MERKIRKKKTDTDNSVRKLIPVTELESENDLEDESDLEANNKIRGKIIAADDQIINI